MKVLIDIPDAEAQFLSEVTDDKALLMSEIREAVEEMKLIRSGKKQARKVEEFLNEL